MIMITEFINFANINVFKYLFQTYLFWIILYFAALKLIFGNIVEKIKGWAKCISQN